MQCACRRDASGACRSPPIRRSPVPQRRAEQGSELVAPDVHRRVANDPVLRLRATGKGIERLDPATNLVYLGGRGNVPKDVGVTVSHKLFAPTLGIAYRPVLIVGTVFGSAAALADSATGQVTALAATRLARHHLLVCIGSSSECSRG